MSEKEQSVHWEERLAALEPRLLAWEERFAAELARELRRRGGFLRRPSAADRDAAEIEARSAAGEAEPREAATLLVELADVFLSALPGERARIRARVGSQEACFRVLDGTLESLPGWARDERRLRLALALFAIHDLRAGRERVERLLADLWVGAEEHGLDAAAAFAEVAPLANPATSGGAPGFREHLERFPGSRTFREHVLPRLRTRRRSRAS